MFLQEPYILNHHGCSNKHMGHLMCYSSCTIRMEDDTYGLVETKEAREDPEESRF